MPEISPLPFHQFALTPIHPCPMYLKICLLRGPPCCRMYVRLPFAIGKKNAVSAAVFGLLISWIRLEVG